MAYYKHLLLYKQYGEYLCGFTKFEIFENAWMINKDLTHLSMLRNHLAGRNDKKVTHISSIVD